MDFTDTTEDAEFRAEVRGWLTANAEEKKPGAIYKAKYGEVALIPLSQEWQTKKFKAGFSGITTPLEYGGRGGTQIQQAIYDQEEVNFLVPRHIGSGIPLVIPTLLVYAKEEDKKKFIPEILCSDKLWCQLFSEPSAGSDLGGIRTRSERDGDDWVINGQKIWTSNAQHADLAILVTRSDPDAEKHKGLTYFYVDMKSPGIEVRPIKQISGMANFNEVFLTDVRIPDSQRLGEEGEGWRVAITTLMNERVSSGARPAPDFEDIFGLARDLEIEDGPAIANAAVREKLAHWYIQARGVDLTRMRTLTAMSRGQTPGPENSISKLVSAFKRQEIALFGMDLMDMGGGLMSRETTPMRAVFQEAALEAPSGRIAAGTDEILRNIIGERALGLPREVRVDKDKPFRDLPTGV